MKRERHSAETIISKRRETEVLLQKGWWRKGCGDMRADQAKRLKGLKKENTRLEKIIADRALDGTILKGVASGRF